MNSVLCVARPFLFASIAGLLALPVSVQAQLVTDPLVIEFMPSVNQDVLGNDGTPLVTRYDLQVYKQGTAAPLQVFSLGRPTPTAGGLVRVTWASIMTARLTGGVVYEARVVAVGPGGTAISAVSNTFAFSVPCTFTVTPSSLSIAGAGGSSSETVTTGAGCTWTAASSLPWLAIGGGAGGSGNGTVTLAFTSNPAASARSGTLTIGGHSVLVTQAGTPCAFGVTPTAQSAGAPAGSGAITVTAGSGCGWTAVSSAAWLTIASGATGSANGTVTYSLGANTLPNSRVGTVSVAGRPVTVTQAAAPLALPGVPAAPSPVTGATAVSAAPNLTWSATGASTYDIKLSTSNPPTTVVAANLAVAAYQSTLPAGAKYFWQVVARNSAGTTAGPVWALTTASAPIGGLPAPWTSQDIGAVGVAGNATYANATFTVAGGGLDIWGAADAFRYVSQPLGDGTIVARVTTLQNTHANAKAGVMMRGALTAAAAHVMLNAAVDGSIEFISRSSTGTAATFLAGALQGRPAWLKLARAGSIVTGSVSSDGQRWTLVGSTSVAGLTSAGLVVTSGDPAVRNLSTFDAVTVSTATGTASRVLPTVNSFASPLQARGN